MTAFIAKRLLTLIATLAVVSMLAFMIPYVSGGDPVRNILRARSPDPVLDPAAVAALTEQLGLDRPIYQQYWEWLSLALRGDFGLSFTARTPVDEMFLSGLGVSLSLSLGALLVALLIGLPMGILAATRPAGIVDNVTTFITQTLVALPEYWVGPLLVLVFTIHLGWLPSAGWDEWSSMILPTLVLAMRPIAYFAQVARAAMFEVLRSPYMVAARARGLGAWQAITRHGLKNAMLPVMTLFSLWLTGLLGGSVIVEVIFAVPGMGWLLYEAVLNNDVPLLQGALVCIVALTVGINTLSDVVTALLNPAIKIPGKGA